MVKVGLIGVGRLGLCFALNLERGGVHVVGVDSNSDYIQSLQEKTLNTNEPQVKELLLEAKHLFVSTDLKKVVSPEISLIFICVPTPSLSDGTFNHKYIDNICDELLIQDRPFKETHLIINSTVMPGYCEALHKRMKLHGYTVSYNPEFIAQGSIIKDQLYPDQILIGEANVEVGNEIEAMYSRFVLNKPRYSRMSRTEAEITKLAVNCFLTTKIAFANSIGDLTIQHNCNQDRVLKAIGSDSRIGNNFLRYGFGYGGPCLPRDNRAMYVAAKDAGLNLPICEATDLSNDLHRIFQREEYEKRNAKDDYIIFNGLSYKPNSDIIEESQKLALAVDLARIGHNVLLKDRKAVINQIQALYADLFTYELMEDE